MSSLLELHYLYLNTWVTFFLYQYCTVMYFKEEVIADGVLVACNEMLT